MASADNSSSFGFLLRSEYEELCGKVNEDFVSKLNIDERPRKRPPEGEESEPSSRGSFESVISDQQHEDDDEEEGEEEAEAEIEEEEEEEDFEFSFACGNPDGSPISADVVFHNGQIRPIYPLFDQSLLLGDSGDEGKAATYQRQLLKKLFVEMAEPDDLDGAEEGTYCVWNGKTVKEVAELPESCRKSNSTGFSRRWWFRDLVHLSSSDRKDAFVFLNPQRAQGGGGKVQHAKKDEEVGMRTAVRKDRKTKTGATATAKGQAVHEKHYVRNRAAKERDRRKSYLPYRRDLVWLGFFTNVGGMTRNVHPF